MDVRGGDGLSPLTPARDPRTEGVEVCRPQSAGGARRCPGVDERTRAHRVGWRPCPAAER